MKRAAKWLCGALLAAGGMLISAAPAEAGASAGISFGWYGPGAPAFSDPCDYYDYYDEAPPWGLPPDYCEFPVFFGPVYWGGTWYRGPIYYRWDGGRRLYWLNGGWRIDAWRGGPPPAIRWSLRGRRGPASGYPGERRPSYWGPDWHGEGAGFSPPRGDGRGPDRNWNRGVTRGAPPPPSPPRSGGYGGRGPDSFSGRNSRP